MDKIKLKIKGNVSASRNHPHEGRWRRAIAEFVRTNVANSPFKHSKNTRYFVHLTFELNYEKGYRNVDMNNLARPVLDTLFNGKSRKHPTGVLFSRSNKLVMELHVRKRLKEVLANKEIVKILVKWK